MATTLQLSHFPLSVPKVVIEERFDCNYLPIRPLKDGQLQIIANQNQSICPITFNTQFITSLMAGVELF